MATPLINALRVQGGTFYTFISAANDIAKTFTDDDVKFSFSKFALLNLPDVATPTNDQNYIVWEALGARAVTTLPNSSVPVIDLSSDNNINFAQSFQNYVLNFEQLILDGKNTKNEPYNSKEKHTVGERLFWKWLANINAIRFRNANNSESKAVSRYVEENETDYYSKVVKYIGDIDIVNNISKHGQTYSEIYLNVPSSHGNTPIVLFKTYQDSNYLPLRQWDNNNQSYIDGRNSNSIHPNGLSLTPYWDDLSNGRYLSYSTFDDVTNKSNLVSTTGSGKPVLLSRLDGVMLDMDPSNYKPIADDPKISLISEYNTTSAAGDFSFNAALIYYDMSNSDKTSTARNLYGVLILDNYDNQSNVSFIKRFDKYKSNNITKMNGNGYGLKLNIKFDTSADNVGIETVINEYNTFSMSLFSEATAKMQEAANLFIDQKLEMVSIKNKLDELENYFYSQDDLTSIVQRVNLLEQKLNNSNLSFSTNTISSLVDLINKNSDNINNMLNGKLTNTLSYNTDIINAGDGLLLDKSVKNQVTLINRNQSIGNFMICKNSSGYLLTNTDNGLNMASTTNNNVLFLGKYNNYFKQKNQNKSTNGIETFGDNLYINIDDSNVSWSKGQTLKLVFDDPINTNSLNIIFRTDAKNVSGEGIFGKTMVIIKPSQLLSNKPIIEIYCENEKLYTFGVDILR